jgi:hypothetical protein
VRYVAADIARWLVQCKIVQLQHGTAHKLSQNEEA